MPPKSPAPGKRRVLTFASPKVSDLLFFELRDSTLPTYSDAPEYGTAHPDSRNYPDHVLVFIAPAGATEAGDQRWYYAAHRDSQDDYNYEIKGDDNLIRTYVIPREDYEGGDFPEPTVGTDDTSFDTFQYTSQVVRRVQQKELDSYFVFIQRFFVKDGDVTSVSETGTARGETSRETVTNVSSTATTVGGGIVMGRSSTETPEKAWRNTEDKLSLREGVKDTTVDFSPGVKTTRTSELSSAEPTQDADDRRFSKSMVTTDVDGNDAVWKADRETTENSPSTGSELSNMLGGGVVSVNHSKVDESQEAQGGFDVVQDTITPTGNGDARRVRKVIEGFVPLVESRYDEDTNRFITISKYPVAPGTPGASSPGDVTEVKPYDRWRSIAIRSSYDESPEGYTETLPIVDNYRYPPKLVDAEFIWNYAWASGGGDSAYAEDLALVFDVDEAYTTAVTGHIKRIWTSDPETTAASYKTASTTQLNSVTVGYAHWWAYGGLNGAKAQATVRTWQTPLAIVESAITLTLPATATGTIPTDDEIMVNNEATSTIPASGTYPSGLTTVNISTSRAKLGMYVVSIKQLDL